MSEKTSDEKTKKTENNTFLQYVGLGIKKPLNGEIESDILMVLKKATDEFTPIKTQKGTVDYYGILFQSNENDCFFLCIPGEKKAILDNNDWVFSFCKEDLSSRFVFIFKSKFKGIQEKQYFCFSLPEKIFYKKVPLRVSLKGHLITDKVWVRTEDGQRFEAGIADNLSEEGLGIEPNKDFHQRDLHIGGAYHLCFRLGIEDIRIKGKLKRIEQTVGFEFEFSEEDKKKSIPNIIKQFISEILVKEKQTKEIAIHSPKVPIKKEIPLKEFSKKNKYNHKKILFFGNNYILPEKVLENYQLISYNNIFMVLKMINEKSFDLIISDIYKPSQDELQKTKDYLKKEITFDFLKSLWYKLFNEAQKKNLPCLVILPNRNTKENMTLASQIPGRNITFVACFKGKDAIVDKINDIFKKQDFQNELKSRK